MYIIFVPKNSAWNFRLAKLRENTKKDQNTQGFHEVSFKKNVSRLRNEDHCIFLHSGEQ